MLVIGARSGSLSARSYLNVQRIYSRTFATSLMLQSPNGAAAAVGALPRQIEFTAASTIFSNRNAETSDVELETDVPVVVVYSWLMANNKALSKFRDLYLANGVDVLMVKTSVGDAAWPPKAQRLVDQAIQFLEHESMEKKPVIVHSFSIGSYLYGEMLRRSSRRLLARVAGQVLDSPIDYTGVPNGLARTLFKRNILLMHVAKTIFWVYILLTYPFTLRNYKGGSVAFHHHPAGAPSLWLFSKVDDFMPASGIEKAISIWESKGIECRRKCWDDSPHILHYYYNSEEYVRLMNAFLENILGASTTPRTVEEGARKRASRPEVADM